MVEKNLLIRIMYIPEKNKLKVVSLQVCSGTEDPGGVVHMFFWSRMM